MANKILCGIMVIILIILVGLVVLFYRPDINKEGLPQYIKDSSRFLRLPNGANMHYRDEGNQDGPVLVMIHGGFGSLQNWEGWVEQLKADYRLISMDLLGHGLTGSYPANVYDRIAERDAVYQLLQALDIGHFAVAGNSFGGGVALELALQYPQQVSRLILVDSEGIPNSDDGYDASLFSDSEAVSPDSPEFTQLSWFERSASQFISKRVIRSVMEQMTFNKSLLTDEYVDYFSEVNRHQGNREAQLLMFRQGMYLVEKNGPQDLLPRLSELNMPVLVVNGKQDELVPVSVAEKFHQHINNSQLAIVDQAGHMPMMEKPKETAAIIRDFIND
ncbi:alpha/beta fold hydrolase [Bacterioplanoides sp.]|uniref:alpha/beta fold hydrolase n=1 Tax=Bacterioplanoides sp. TaxID=2066072 RepID=UPI003B5D0246